MGSNICSEQHNLPPPKTVTYLPNSSPQDANYRVYESDSLRFCEITAAKSQRNTYLFTMKMRNEIDIHECIPVLNEILYCVGYENYQLKIEEKMIIDIFDCKLTSTLISVRSEKNLSQFSMKVVPFVSYNSIQFKKVLYQLYLNKQLKNNASIVKLLDCYIYGVNTDKQSLIFLFEKCITNLANIAEYRKRGNMKWKLGQKIKIIYDVLVGYQNIYKKNIIHRDLRPNNVFYSAHSGKFVIGNFSKARLLRRNYQHDKMSVCGVPSFSCQEMKRLILQGQEIGEYEGMNQDYCGIKSILNIVETCEIYDNDPEFKQPEMKEIANMVNRQAQIRVILTEIEKFASGKKINLEKEIGDRNVGENCSLLLAKTHKNVMEELMFEAYGCLGYFKYYAEKAQKMMEKNNKINKEYENALILRNLGDFCQSNNGDGTELYYNSFLLYIVRADKQINYGFAERAERDLNHAKEIYFKFNQVIESQVPRMEISRVTALIFLEENDLQNAVRIIKDVFVKAASYSLSIEKQCNILLAYGKICKRIPEARDEALKKLSIGLSICQNVGAFKNGASSKIYKSRFMKQIGMFHLGDLQMRYDSRRKEKTGEEVYSIEQAETYLKAALEIQEKQLVDDLQVAGTLQSLGKLSYLQHNFHDAKRYYDAAKVRYAHMKHLIHPMKQINVLYMRGSCCYYLKQLQEARIDYQTCLLRLDKFSQSEQLQILAYNITGNLGLVLIQIGDPSGKGIVEDALNQLKQVKGEHSYDYATMYQHYLNVTKS